MAPRLLWIRDMQGLAALLLATMLVQGPPAALEADRERDRTPRPSFAIELELEVPTLEEVLRETFPVSELLYVRNGWVGISLTEDLAILVDVRTEGIPSSPDPARPMSRGSFSATLGIALSSWDG
ncbi:hypothetical protein [Sandaracinus amylolyticus]|uniref:Uncharacterized protein n=1 Tax=Sandaracinus amylolyticus TaxID=927083 RepID=A0A0F6SI35_9BACT|nr:hypothetical protein [Sandaracinus amylolyticus]AKF11504.1 hypothetical protein DB32_008653 [Sandaracinus amylolyticus]